MKPDKQQFSDHDLLITLNTKFDNLSLDVKVMGDGLSGRVLALERWKEEIDLYHAKIPLSRYEKAVTSFESYQSNIKLIVFIGFPIYTLFLALLASLIRKFLGF